MSENIDDVSNVFIDIDDHHDVFNMDGTLKQEFIEEVKIFNENPLNNPNLSRKEKLAYIETLDCDEELKQLFRESVNFVESFKNV